MPSTAPAVAELPTLSAVTVSVESVFCLNARVTLDVTAELVAPKPSYYSRHRKQVLDKAKKTSRITLHICSCGKEIEGYDISKKHAQLMGHSIVGKRVQKMSRDEKTAEMEQKKGMLLSMGALGAVTVEVDN